MQSSMYSKAVTMLAQTGGSRVTLPSSLALASSFRDQSTGAHVASWGVLGQVS